MPDLPVGTTESRIVRFVQENAGVTGSLADSLETVDVPIEERDWPVTDPEARAKVARELLGEEVDEWWTKHAQWFIDEEKNAAGLCVYRWKTPANVKDWGERTGQQFAPK